MSVVGENQGSEDTWTAIHIPTLPLLANSLLSFTQPVSTSVERGQVILSSMSTAQLTLTRR